MIDMGAPRVCEIFCACWNSSWETKGVRANRGRTSTWARRASARRRAESVPPEKARAKAGWDAKKESRVMARALCRGE